MIIGAKLHDHRVEKDKEIFTHIQDNRPILKACAEERKEYDKSFKRDRIARKIASIPSLVFFNHPEFHDDDKALRRWLDNEGRGYRTDR